MIYAAALMFVVVHPRELGAQSNNSGTSTSGQLAPNVRPAPVGHRQPTVDSVEKAQSAKGDSQKSQTTRGSDLDKNLMICRGC
jgi:hypothetical protein